MRIAGRVGAIGIELVLSIFLGYFAGRWLDSKLGTGPWLQWIGLALGLVAGPTLLWAQPVGQAASGRILVMPFENVTRESRIIWLGEAAAVDRIPGEDRHLHLGAPLWVLGKGGEDQPLGLGHGAIPARR